MTGSDGLNHGIVLANMADVADTETLVEYGKAAEESGWDGVFLIDHLIYPPEQHDGCSDPWITLAGIAARTESIKLASWVTPVARRQPWQLARNLATLDRLSGGRVILGTGLGSEPDYTPFGQSYDPPTLGTRYDEALDVIAGLWSGGPFTYDGEYFTLDDVTLLPPPVQEPRIPIIAGGFWPNKAPFKRGARWDGIAPLSPVIRGVEDNATQGDEVTQSPTDELRAMVEYYLDVTDDSGEIFLPLDFPDAPSDVVELYQSLGVTWGITTTWDQSHNYNLTMERIREGPPA